MTQAGGPAAINGFLFQIIHHLGWLADVTLTGSLDGQEVKDACLVLEPRSGGDARAEASGTYLVEQYKTRQGGSWSLADLESVLCDLRSGVPPSRPESARYRFVTDGHAGRLDTFGAFLADIKSVAGPDDLDNGKKRNFGKNLVVTDHEFFDHIIGATQTSASQSTAEERAVVFHLLSHFEMEFSVSGSARAIEVEGLLRRYAPDLGDECKVREHLVGVLVERLSKGETRLDAAGIDLMFRHVGLNPERLRRLAALPETMNALTRRRLARLKYQPIRDVRNVPEWPADKPVLLIAGESGTGKTWQLGRLLEAFGQERKIATLVPAARTREDLLTQASRDLWQTGLGETSDKSLIAVTNFLRELAPSASTPELIVALDGVQDIDLARDLVRQDWVDCGVRLVLTVPRSVARSLVLTDGDAIHLHSVDEFSVDELDTLLRRNGRRWADLPSDLKKLLRSPILAGLFLELPYVSVQSAPRSEYEIFEGFWERITAKGRLGDEGIVTALATHMHEGKPYPLPRPIWREIGLDSEEALARLETTGWVRSTEIGEVAFAHDRLLNWAVAESVVQRFQRRQLSISDLAAFIAGSGDEDRNVRRQLGYVPMDTLWLLSRDAQHSATLGQLVARLEDSREFGSYGEDLYVHLLPTLGQRAVPILIERLSAITTDSDGGYQVSLIGKAFANLAKQENVELEEAINSLLNAPSRNRQNVAIAALTAMPDARCLDRLWQLHQQHLDALEDKTDGSRYGNYEASFAALRAGIMLDPEWLRNRILEADAEKERVSALGYLLNALDHPDAPAIWKETGDALMAKVSASKPRSLLYCIARFLDREKLHFVVKHLSRSEDFASGAALAALSVLDPLAAINRLTEVKESERYFTRNNWLPILLRAQPELTRKRIRELAEADPKGRLLVEHLFSERPDEMDEAMLRFVLRALENDLREHLGEAVTGDPIWLCHPLDLLGRIVRPEFMAILEAEAGGELERMIAAVACSCLRTNSNYRDHVRESARRILILMGGEGITTLIKRELESEHFWVRHSGLKWAFVRADDGIVERLGVIAGRPIPRDANGKPKSEPYQEFHQALTALAALGADPALVDALWRSGMAEVPVDLAWLRVHRGSMPKTLTYQAQQTLQSTAPSEDLLLTALAIAWLSRDADLIPVVRAALACANPEGRVASYACIALQELGDQSDAFAQLAVRLAHSEINARRGLKALVGLGNRGLELVGSWLRRNAGKRTDHDSLVIRALYRNPETRKLSVEGAVDRCLRGGFLLDPPYDIAAEASDAALREQILDKAFAARSFVTTLPLRAIEGLAKFDATRAVEAIELALQSHPTIERQLCRLLVRIAPETAAAKLIAAAISIERGSLRPAAGRALRRLDPQVVSRLVVERMASSASERKTAAQLAGLLPIRAITAALGHLADHDSAREVRHAALLALDLHQREAHIRALLAAFPSSIPARRWSLLIAIVEGADPYLLSDREDPLWLGRILSDDVPAAFAHYADSVLRQRKQKGN
ncbi:MAG: ATP-binding protein [Betaproteobacteria bacterium]|nr:ATP-binding protein [Betaproteobacteria bacterium]